MRAGDQGSGDAGNACLIGPKMLGGSGVWVPHTSKCEMWGSQAEKKQVLRCAQDDTFQIKVGGALILILASFLIPDFCS
jgi:hypothetical protein